MRKPIIAGNWKMYKKLAEAVQFVEEVKGQVPSTEQVESVVCAPAIFLPTLVEATKGTNLSIGAQNMHYEAEGAFTGEISPTQLTDIGVQYVVLGHSERREYFNETDEAVNKKAHAAFANGITPILCCGETLEEREAGQTVAKVAGQVTAAIAGLTPEQVAKSVIAYEPIWAIGTGKTATSEDANETCGEIRAAIASAMNEEVAQAVRIQYGGSVKPANIVELLSMEHIDGALVGGASLETASYLQLLEAGKNA